MRASYKSKNSKSFFTKEKDKLEALIEEPLLIQVLSHLPHLQITPDDQDTNWEIVAINLNKYHINHKFGTEGVGADQAVDTPLLNGLYVKEVYESLETKFLQKYTIMGQLSDTVVSMFTKRSEYLLLELQKLKGYDSEVLAKLGKEHYEEQQRIKFARSLEPLRELKDGDTYADDQTKTLLEEYRDSSDKMKLQVYEKELAKKNKKLEQLAEENRKLLELNHDLLSNRFQDNGV